MKGIGYKISIRSEPTRLAIFHRDNIFFFVTFTSISKQF